MEIRQIQIARCAWVVSKSPLLEEQDMGKEGRTLKYSCSCAQRRNIVMPCPTQHFLNSPWEFSEILALRVLPPSDGNPGLA